MTYNIITSYYAELEESKLSLFIILIEAYQNIWSMESACWN